MKDRCHSATTNYGTASLCELNLHDCVYVCDVCVSVCMFVHQRIYLCGHVCECVYMNECMCVCMYIF